MGHSVKGHNGILLPSMLIFTAWADLLFFLISVNFRICLSSRLTPFLEVPWNLKIKLIITTEKKQTPQRSKASSACEVAPRQGAGGAPGPSWFVFSLPRGGKCFPHSICRAQVEAVALTAITVQGQSLCSWIQFGSFVSIGWSCVRTTVHLCVTPLGLPAGELDTDTL